jgi:hypothetical protein
MQIIQPTSYGLLVENVSDIQRTELNMEFLVIILMGAFAYTLMSVLIKIPALKMKRKFARLGLIEGKTKAEITRVAGPPSNVHDEGQGRAWWHWITAGYHMSLLFHGDVCERATELIGE